MINPTKKQQSLLQSIEDNGGSSVVIIGQDPEVHQELVKIGYLREFTLLSGAYRYASTDLSVKYLLDQPEKD